MNSTFIKLQEGTIIDAETINYIRYPYMKKMPDGSVSCILEFGICSGRSVLKIQYDTANDAVNEYAIVCDILETFLFERDECLVLSRDDIDNVTSVLSHAKHGKRFLKLKETEKLLPSSKHTTTN